MKRDFDTWFASFKGNIADYSYYVDFDKVYKNVDDMKIELHILNSLIGSGNIEKDFIDILHRYPEVLRCIPILLAVRKKEIPVTDEKGDHVFSFQKSKNTVDEYVLFMKQTGLFDLFEKRIITNVVDYVTGVETGLDSNGRKNRGGHLMENLVERYIVSAGFIKYKTYFKEMYIHDIEEKWAVDLSAISNEGKMEKRFDYVVKTDSQIYVVETNFYSSGGSKLNETARSYKTLAQEIATINDLTFVWFTDGKGWKRAKNNLEETFDVMEHVYNIHDLASGVLKKVCV
ncbi:MAG: type II restriction endonuclease [Actinomycetaceae bacterium]|nr:type II restriction endonuclease [Actinomycetaceae bacterium]